MAVFDAPVRPPLRLPRRLSPATRRALRRALTLLALAPLTVLFATRVPHLGWDPILGLYGILTLSTTGFVMYVAFARYRDPSQDAPVAAPVPGEEPLVSCLVAVKNEIEVIDRCVRSIVDSDYPRMEVIIVDDGSTDGTRERLLELRERHPQLRVLFMPGAGGGKKRALTAGVAHAGGDFVVFTDSDCILRPDAITHVMRAFAAHPDVGAVSGHARALNADHNPLTKMQDAWYDGQFSVWKAAESVFGAVTCISGPLAAFRREAIYNYFPAWANDSFLGGEFRFATDRQLTGYVLGSTAIGEDLKRRYADSIFVSARDYPVRNWRIEYVKAAKVQTVVPSSLRHLLHQQVRWKKSFLRNLCFTGRFYWRKGLAPAYIYYSHVLFVLAMPFMAFRHLVWLPLHGGWTLTALYLAGVMFKGAVWGVAYRVENPGCPRWVYRPLMSLVTATLFSMLLIYSTLTLRRNVWVRG
jgi:cellulose synthase/poly-beta-1,6-N-acetylglucosamine synthase-like glycosyltransferase